jgi:hypothetical protein
MYSSTHFPHQIRKEKERLMGAGNPTLRPAERCNALTTITHAACMYKGTCTMQRHRRSAAVKKRPSRGPLLHSVC